MANHVNSTEAKSNKGFPAPRDFCFRALNEIDNALTDLKCTLSATYRLMEVDAEYDPSRSLAANAMERHLDGDMRAVYRAFSNAHREILNHASHWQPRSNKGGTR